MKNTEVMKDDIPTLEVNNPSGLVDYMLIDVRGLDEFNGELGHIEGAKLVTLGKELDFFLREEDKNKKILFICRSGARSGKATQQAQSLGFSQVFNMDGGMIDWNNKKFPIQKGATMKCQKNIHPVERGIRVIAGLVLISLAFVGPQNKWFLLGVIPLLTGFLGWCPPYQLLGISTLKKTSNCCHK